MVDSPFETAVFGDGILTLSPLPKEEEHDMAIPDFIGAASAHTMEQSMVRYNDGSAATAVTEKQEFVKDLKIANVTGLQMLEQDGLAASLLQQKAAGNYPPNTTGGA